MKTPTEEELRKQTSTNLVQARSEERHRATWAAQQAQQEWEQRWTWTIAFCVIALGIPVLIVQIWRMCH